MAKCRLKDNRGFTLVEAVLAVMIMGFALGVCILSFSLAKRIVGTGQYQMTAMHATRMQVERLRMNSFTNSTLAVGTTSFSNSFGSGTYVVEYVNSATKNVTVNVPYLNRLRGGFSTNSVTTSFTSTLHP